MAQTLVNIRMDEELKRNMEELCKELGITMSAAFNMFARKMTREKRIPFEISVYETNKSSNLENLTVNDEDVLYITQNGYNTKVLMSIEKYANIIKDLELEEAIEKKFGNVNIEKALENSEKDIDNPEINHLTHKDIISKARRLIDGNK